MLTQSIKNQDLAEIETSNAIEKAKEILLKCSLKVEKFKRKSEIVINDLRGNFDVWLYANF